jgi:preprotein translocase subunit SecG
MYQAIIVVHVLLGLSVIGFVLIQQGKGADAGAAFGSASSGSVFGAQGASSFLSRATAILAALFFSTSLGLAVLSGQTEDSVDLMDAPEVEEISADVPLVNGTESLPDFDAIPVINEGATEAGKISEDISTVDVVTEPVQSVADESGNKTQALIKEVKDVVSDKIDSTLEKNQ